MRAPGRLLVALAVAVSGLVGCGSNGPLTHAEFRREASDVCDRGNRRVVRVQVPPIPHHGTPRAIARVVDVHRTSLRDLRALEPPKDQRKHVDKWLAVLDQLLDEADAVRASLVARDVQHARGIAVRAIVLDGRVRALAADSGIRPCRVRPRSLGV